MFTSPINTLVDFLFIDILSAPTADSLKLDELDTVHRLAGVLANFGNSAMTATRKMGRRISQAAQQAAGVILKPTDKPKIQTTRTIPPTTLEAQIIASKSAGNIVDKISQENVHRLTQRKAERVSSIIYKKRQTFIQQRMSIHPTKTASSESQSDQIVPTPAPVSAPTPTSAVITTSTDSSSIEDLFTEFWVDLIEQRKLLPGTEQEYFDEKWG